MFNTQLYIMIYHDLRENRIEVLVPRGMEASSLLGRMIKPKWYLKYVFYYGLGYLYLFLRYFQCK